MTDMETTEFSSAIHTLEFDKIREKLASFAPTLGSKELALSLVPVSSPIMVKSFFLLPTRLTAMLWQKECRLSAA